MTQLCFSHSVKDKGEFAWNQVMYIEDTPLAQLFMGQLLSSLWCTNCGHTSMTFDPVWDLALPFPAVSVACSYHHPPPQHTHTHTHTHTHMFKQYQLSAGYNYQYLGCVWTICLANHSAAFSI